MKNIFIAILIVVAIGLVGYGISQSKSSNDNNTVAQQDDSMMSDDKMDNDDSMMEDDKMMDDKDDSMMEDDKIMGEDDSMMSDDDKMMEKSGEYVDYNPSLLARAQDGDVVLFFHAGWCPTCKTLDAAIKSEMSSIPSDLTILKVDYDSETELKKKYGITYQHTLVQVDAQGNQITKWTGGSDLNSIVSRLK